MIAALPPFLDAIASHLGYDYISFWIVVTAIFVNISCALLGCFLVLRRMSLLGDAISHAILPGLALGFMLSGTRDIVPMLLGALVVGILTAILTQALHRFAQVPEDAAMGVVFTSLFALGVILIHQVASHVDLDPGCVLYGLIESAGLDTFPLGAYEISRPAFNMGIVCLVVIGFVIIFWKELKIVSFDPQMAVTQGINANLIHYLLMGMVAAVTVTAFEAVGSILVVAMLIAPAAMAYMLTNRLSLMVVLAAIGGVCSAILGRELAQGDSHLAQGVCGIFSFVASLIVSLAGMLRLEFHWTKVPVEYTGTSVPGMISVVAGFLFALAVIFSPSHGVLFKAIRQWRLSLRIVCEDVLALLYRWQEVSPDTLARGEATAALGGGLLPRIAFWTLLRSGRIAAQRSSDGRAGFALTDKGRRQAQTLVKSHRLWETYLQQVLGFPADHVHAPADRAEHFISENLVRDVAAAVDNPHTDPHGKPIPRRDGSGDIDTNESKPQL